MVRKIEAEFDLQTGTAIEAEFSVLNAIPVSEAEHNDLSGRDEDDAHPISAITDLQETLDGLETAIESEATTRANTDTTLQTNINTEASTRQAADTTLTNNLNTEIATRENADTVLSTAISTEATARQNADSGLSDRITANTNNFANYRTSANQDTIDAQKVQKNDDITAGTHTKITYDKKGLVTSGTDLSESDIPSLHLSKITDVTATASEVNVLDGITATTQELNYTDGVTSNIQTQLDAKQGTLPTLESGKFLTNDGTNLSWSSVDALPTQTGNASKALFTNGSTASWGYTVIMRKWS